MSENRLNINDLLFFFFFYERIGRLDRKSRQNWYRKSRFRFFTIYIVRFFFFIFFIGSLYVGIVILWFLILDFLYHGKKKNAKYSK